jgi:hypothetical protein
MYKSGKPRELTGPGFDPFSILLNPRQIGLAVVTGVFFLGLCKVRCGGAITTRCEGRCVERVPAEILDGSDNFSN